MRKIISILGIVLILISVMSGLTACGGKQKKQSGESSKESVSTPTPTPSPNPTPSIPTPTPKPALLSEGIYKIEKSREFYRDISFDSEIPVFYLPEYKRYSIDGQLTLTTLEITDEYIRVHSSYSIRKAKNTFFPANPSKNDYLIDNLGNKYESINYGGNYAICQVLEDDQEYQGYIDFRGRPPAGADTFFYYSWELQGVPIEFTLKGQQPLSIIVFESIKQQLIEKFAPILWLHPNEVYEPKEVSIFTDQAEVKNKDGEVVLDLEKISYAERLERFGEITGKDLYLDFKRINIEDEADDYSVIYTNLLKGNYKTTIYARVIQWGGKTIVQYWFFYFFNDWYNIHEGDWEMIELVFNGNGLENILNSGVPEVAAYSQHEKILGLAPGGTKESWGSVGKEGNHPYVYVAKGSHSNYFKPKNYFLDIQRAFVAGIGMQQLIKESDGIDETSSQGRKFSPSDHQLILLSEETSWLNFQGLWGEEIAGLSKISAGAIRDNGPQSPVLQDSWQYPLRWITQRPDDSDYW